MKALIDKDSDLQLIGYIEDLDPCEHCPRKKICLFREMIKLKKKMQ